MRIACAVVLACQIGCVELAQHESGREINFRDAERLTPGVSTREDAERLFGHHRSEAKMPDGTFHCFWAYGHYQIGGFNGARALTLAFRSDGRYIGVVSKSATGVDESMLRNETGSLCEGDFDCRDGDKCIALPGNKHGVCELVK